MDPVTILGAVGSVVGIAAFGLQLSQFLNKFIDEYQTAAESLEAILEGIESTNEALEQVREFLLAEEKNVTEGGTRQLFSLKALKQVKTTSDKCLKVFWRIEAAILKKNPTDEEIRVRLVKFHLEIQEKKAPVVLELDKGLKLSRLGRWRWSFSVSEKLEKYNRQLDRQQSTLILMFQVISLQVNLTKPNLNAPHKIHHLYEQIPQTALNSTLPEAKRHRQSSSYLYPRGSDYPYTDQWLGGPPGYYSHPGAPQPYRVPQNRRSRYRSVTPDEIIITRGRRRSASSSPDRGRPNANFGHMNRRRRHSHSGDERDEGRRARGDGAEGRPVDSETIQEAIRENIRTVEETISADRVRAGRKDSATVDLRNPETGEGSGRSRFMQSPTRIDENDADSMMPQRGSTMGSVNTEAVHEGRRNPVRYQKPSVSEQLPETPEDEMDNDAPPVLEAQDQAIIVENEPALGYNAAQEQLAKNQDTVAADYEAVINGEMPTNNAELRGSNKEANGMLSHIGKEAETAEAAAEPKPTSQLPSVIDGPPKELQMPVFMEQKDEPENLDEFQPPLATANSKAPEQVDLAESMATVSTPFDVREGIMDPDPVEVSQHQRETNGELATESMLNQPDHSALTAQEDDLRFVLISGEKKNKGKKLNSAKKSGKSGTDHRDLSFDFGTDSVGGGLQTWETSWDSSPWRWSGMKDEGKGNKEIITNKSPNEADETKHQENFDVDQNRESGAQGFPSIGETEIEAETNNVTAKVAQWVPPLPTERAEDDADAKPLDGEQAGSSKGKSVDLYFASVLPGKRKKSVIDQLLERGLLPTPEPVADNIINEWASTIISKKEGDRPRLQHKRKLPPSSTSSRKENFPQANMPKEHMALIPHPDRERLRSTQEVKENQRTVHFEEKKPDIYTERSNLTKPNDVDYLGLGSSRSGSDRKKEELAPPQIEIVSSPPRTKSRGRTKASKGTLDATEANSSSKRANEPATIALQEPTATERKSTNSGSDDHPKAAEGVKVAPRRTQAQRRAERSLETETPTIPVRKIAGRPEEVVSPPEFVVSKVNSVDQQSKSAPSKAKLEPTGLRASATISSEPRKPWYKRTAAPKAPSSTSDVVEVVEEDEDIVVRDSSTSYTTTYSSSLFSRRPKKRFGFIRALVSTRGQHYETYDGYNTAFVIRGTEHHQIPYNGSFNHGITKLKRNKAEWWKDYAFLAPEELATLKELLQDTEDCEKELVHLKHLEKGKLQFWSPTERVLIAVVSNETLTRPGLEDRTKRNPISNTAVPNDVSSPSGVTTSSQKADTDTVADDNAVHDFAIYAAYTIRVFDPNNLYSDATAVKPSCKKEGFSEPEIMKRISELSVEGRSPISEKLFLFAALSDEIDKLLASLNGTERKAGYIWNLAQMEHHNAPAQGLRSLTVYLKKISAYQDKEASTDPPTEASVPRPPEPTSAQGERSKEASATPLRPSVTFEDQATSNNRPELKRQGKPETEYKAQSSQSGPSRRINVPRPVSPSSIDSGSEPYPYSYSRPQPPKPDTYGPQGVTPQIRPYSVPAYPGAVSPYGAFPAYVPQSYPALNNGPSSQPYGSQPSYSGYQSGGPRPYSYGGSNWAVPPPPPPPKSAPPPPPAEQDYYNTRNPSRVPAPGPEKPTPYAYSGPYKPSQERETARYPEDESRPYGGSQSMYDDYGRPHAINYDSYSGPGERRRPSVYGDRSTYEPYGDSATSYYGSRARVQPRYSSGGIRDAGFPSDRPHMPYPEYYDGRSYNPFDLSVAEEKGNDIVQKLLKDWTPVGEQDKGKGKEKEKEKDKEGHEGKSESKSDWGEKKLAEEEEDYDDDDSDDGWYSDDYGGVKIGPSARSGGVWERDFLTAKRDRFLMPQAPYQSQGGSYAPPQSYDYRPPPPPPPPRSMYRAANSRASYIDDDNATGSYGSAQQSAARARKEDDYGRYSQGGAQYSQTAIRREVSIDREQQLRDIEKEKLVREMEMLSREAERARYGVPLDHYQPGLMSLGVPPSEMEEKEMARIRDGLRLSRKREDAYLAEYGVPWH